MIEKLYTLKRLTSTRIARELNVDTNYIVRYFSMLRKDGIIVKPDINFAAYGIVRVLIEIENLMIKTQPSRQVEKLKLVKSMYNVLPLNFHIILESGSNCRTLKRNLGDINFHCIISTIGSRPKLEHLYRATRGDYRYLLDEKNMDDIFYDSLIDTSTSRKRFDGLDLDIIMTLSRYPAIKQKHLRESLIKMYLLLKSETAKKRIPQVSHNLSSHIFHAEQLIRGYRVARINRVFRDSTLQLIMQVKCKDITSTIRYIVTHPLVTGSSIIVDKNYRKSLLTSIAVPSGYYNKAVGFFVKAFNEFGCELRDLTALDNHSKFVFSGGSRFTGDYDPKEGWIVIDAHYVRDILDYLFRNNIVEWIGSPPRWVVNLLKKESKIQIVK